VTPARPPGLLALHVLDDAALARRAQDGQTRAFQILVERHSSALRRWLGRVLPNRDSADDVAQEAFLKAWRNLNRWDRRASFRSWLFAIANHAAADARRAGQRSMARDGLWVMEGQEPEASPTAALEAGIDVDRLLSALPQAQRDVVALCYGAGLSHQEAADALGLPLGTVKSHALRGREKAMVLLEARGQKSEMERTGT
jgi:RNA polymerase sigma factor (sigma-70 family)